MRNLRDEARWIIGEIDEAKRLAKAVGKPQLGTSSIEAGRVEEYDQDGALVQIIGEQYDGTHAPVTVNGPTPPEPAGLSLTVGVGSVEARWNGKFVGDAVSPMDFSHVSLHGSRPEVFTPSNETQLATIAGELGDVATVILEPGEWTFGLVAVSKAGKWSELSETVTVEIPDYPAPVDIQDELILLDEKYEGVITESGNLGNRLDQAEQELTAHEGRLVNAEQQVSDAFVQLEATDATAKAAAQAAGIAQAAADTAKSDAAAAAGIAGGKADVLIQAATPATGMRKATTLWIDTTGGANTPKRWSGSAWVAVTDKAAVDAAAVAAAAQSKAQEALTAAGSAQSTAESALTMAGTKGKVFYSESAPSGTGTAEGDLWRRVDGSKNVIGEWYWTGAAWQSSQITTSTIANLDVGKLTVGTGIIADLVAQSIAASTAAFQTVDVKNLFVTTGTMSEAVINKLWADVIHARKVTLNMLAIGDFNNYIATGLGVNNEAIDWASGLTPDFEDVPPGVSHSFKTTVGQGIKASTATKFDVNPGEEFVFEVWVKADKPDSRIFIEMRDQNGAHGVTSTKLENEDLFWGNVSYPVAGATVPTVWTRWRARCIVKPGVRQLYIGSIFFNHSSGTERGAQIWISGLSFRKRFGGEVVLDGSMKARHIDVEDLAANTGFIADLTARIVKSDMFVGKEFFGGRFIGSSIETNAAEGVGLKLNDEGLRAYGPEGGEPVAEIRPDGGTVYQVSDPVTGEVLGGIDSGGGLTGTSLAVSGEARMDGAVVTGGDPISGGHGSGTYGVTMNGRDMLGATFMNYVEQHPNVADGNAWLTVIPHGVVAHQEVSTPNQGWNATGGIDHCRIRAVVTLNAVYGRMYQITYRTPAIRETSNVGGTIGGAHLVYSAPNGAIAAGASGNSSLTGSRYYLRGGDGFDQAMVTTYARCPEDIPEGKIMLGPEVYIYSGRAAVATDVNATARWSVVVADLGMRRSSYTGRDIDSNKQGTAPPPAPTPDPDPVKRYVETVDASWWQAYTGNNSQATHSTYAGAAAQGRTPYAPGNGVMRGLVGFPSQASRLSGATVKKIEVYVYAKSWHASAGGTAVLGVHGHGSKPSTWSSTTDNVTYQKLKRPEGRWITLPSSVHAGFKSGALRGVSFLPPNGSTSTEYYGIFTGNKTKLRVTYEK